MEENENGGTRKSRIAESIHPEIGNGSVWEVNPHFAALRNVDPAKALESMLYSPQEFQKPVEYTSALPEIPAVEDEMPSEDVPVKKNGKKHKAKHKKKDKKAKASNFSDDPTEASEVTSSPVEKETEAETIPLIETKTPDLEHHDPGETLPAEGKRMKKVIQAAEEGNATQPARERRLEPSTETTLSPFTHWLKHLRGSEYVHPYNDDYALDQLANSTKGGISETFADLLAGQGYREQAIEMYKLLMTRFPEKSSFFAAKIEALK